MTKALLLAVSLLAIPPSGVSTAPDISSNIQQVTPAAPSGSKATKKGQEEKELAKALSLLHAKAAEMKAKADADPQLAPAKVTSIQVSVHTGMGLVSLTTQKGDITFLVGYTGEEWQVADYFVPAKG